jgi:hypothetical protein
MYTLRNNQLTVDILDPVADAALLGSRYCTGGYIWQICDARHGPLMSGRCYPDPQPPVFDGQGAPEAFVTPLCRDDVPVGETVTVIGVGEVKRTSDKTPFHARDNPEVLRFCSWEIDAAREHVRMTASQQGHGSSVNLTRTVGLDGRTVVSRTEIVNRGDVPLPLRWFAHPFFPLNRDLRCFKPAFTLTMPENPGYGQTSDGVLFMRESYDWKKGLFQPLGILPEQVFAAEVYHPVISTVNVTTDYLLESLPVWANDRTFSPEPYMAAMVAPGGKLSWGIRYRF